jgi:hypothetical protein
MNAVILREAPRGRNRIIWAAGNNKRGNSAKRAREKQPIGMELRCLAAMKVTAESETGYG